MSPVVGLALATIAFVGTHLAMSHPMRPGLVDRLGERGFAGVYSLISFVTLACMVWAWRSVDDSQPLWVAPLWWWRISSGIMLLALILLAGSFVRNPAFPHPGGAGGEVQAVRPAVGVFAITRHPMNWSFILWALVHISLWGSPRNLIVALGILILAVAGSIGQDSKKRGLLGDSWRGWEARTSFLPFGAILDGRIPPRALLRIWPAVIVGLILWLVATWYHAPLVSPIPGRIPPGIN